MKFDGNYRNETWAKVEVDEPVLLVSVVVDDEQVTLTYEVFAQLMGLAGYAKQKR